MQRTEVKGKLSVWRDNHSQVKYQYEGVIKQKYNTNLNGQWNNGTMSFWNRNKMKAQRNHEQTINCEGTVKQECNTIEWGQ